MYGWLTFDEKKQLVLNYPEWDFMTSPPLSQDAKKARVVRAGPVISAAFPAEEDAKLKLSAAMAVSAALVHVADAEVDYATRMGIAFYRLHRADHEAAQQAIGALVDAEFEAVAPDADPTIGQMVARLKAVGFLLPEFRRGFIFNTFCTQLRNDIIAKHSTKELMPLRTAATEVYRLWDASGKIDAVWTMAHQALISCTPAQLQDTAKCIKLLIGNKRIDVFVELSKSYEATTTLFDRVLRDCALRLGLKTAVAEPHWSASQIASDAFADAQAWDWLEDQTLERISIAAIDSGLDLGERTESSQEALRQVRDLRAQRQQHQTQALITHARQKDTHQTLTVSTTGPDRETLQSWSVYELTRWVEGPVTGPRRTQALDHRQVVERSHGSRPAPKPETPTQVKADHSASASQSTPEPEALTEADVDHIANQAYGATAEYFLGDISDFVTLGEQLNATPKLVGDCAAFTDKLTSLAQSPGKFDEQSALRLLSDAEHAIDQLRADIKTTQATLALQEHFQGQLMNALAKETLAPGRRQGGVIACPLKADDWRWVSNRFHRRWLSSTRYLIADGVPTLLELDEALALYVTGSSHSNYAFDVSVHLWRQLPTKTSLPSLESGLFPPMNTDDWYDTHITCCVLHVPFAH